MVNFHNARAVCKMCCQAYIRRSPQEFREAKKMIGAVFAKGINQANEVAPCQAKIVNQKFTRRVTRSNTKKILLQRKKLLDALEKASSPTRHFAMCKCIFMATLMVKEVQKSWKVMKQYPGYRRNKFFKVKIGVA